MGEGVLRRRTGICALEALIGEGIAIYQVQHRSSIVSRYDGDGASFGIWWFFAETRRRSSARRRTGITNSKHIWMQSLPSLLHVAILAMDKFFNDVQKTNKKPTADPEDPAAPEKKALPKGVVLGKDGKPSVSLSPFPYLHTHCN